jgi:hypothetical protein
LALQSLFATQIPGYVAPQKLQIASYDLQDIVEIVRSTPMT